MLAFCKADLIVGRHHGMAVLTQLTPRARVGASKQAVGVRVLTQLSNCPS